LHPFPTLPYKTYKINLDLPPEEVYKEVNLDMKDKILKFYKFLDTLVPVPSFFYKIIGWYG